MPLANNLEYDKRKTESQPWTKRVLLTLGGISNSISKVFDSPLEWLLAFCLIVIAVGELSGVHLSWFFYTAGSILLTSVLLRRLIERLNADNLKEKTK